MTRTPRNQIESIVSLHAEVRTRAPLVQCITNAVVTNFTANVLLALGAAPAMVDIPGEAGVFAGIASGVLVNLGTPNAEQREAMREAASAATHAGTPWVLDPVAIGALPVRTALAAELKTARPTVVRGNASEIIAFDGAGAGGRGVDATDVVEDAASAARRIALATGGVVAVSGPVDLVTDGIDESRLGNGNALLTRVTGGGCALGAVMAAFAGVTADRFAATVAAITVYNVAAELAAERAGGPGTFASLFLDALAGVDAEILRARAVVR
ncbi:hydroxyethylthiazole kinase [Leifsonia sp. ZF2019]|uniref:hydroxyethylthiazole kinase n=1 Tax=Leifsonia sp. ZF2019 TaxID=2781978 RepID=UPI001CBD7C60|nr:hydroxyethylthiazole kinase [Leifsonia sp. ZF2019]UAJ79502.1 hydroxyethylthiazole kinase [Leifsonia sp. ZF2019]